MSSKNAILSRLRHGRTASPAATQFFAEEQAPQSTTPDLEVMVAALEAAHAQVIRSTTGQWPDDLAKLARERGWASWWVGQDDVGRAWQAHESKPGTTVFSDWDSQKSPLFDVAEVALSRARGGIAETGTLIVESNPQVPRTLSLVPPVHVIIIDEDTVVSSLQQALAHYEKKSLPTNLVFISGPSKTADIQQTLAYGAHGPRELIVYLCRRDT
ncbi:LutC/YkgG family protein [Marinobacter sp. 1Y8]